MRVHLYGFLLSRHLHRGGSGGQAQGCVHCGKTTHSYRYVLFEIAEAARGNVNLVICRRETRDGISALSVGNGVAGGTGIEVLDGDVCVGDDGASAVAHRAANGSGLYLRESSGAEE